MIMSIIYDIVPDLRCVHALLGHDLHKFLVWFDDVLTNQYPPLKILLAC